MIFVSGAIAICAMILPGISGSFMLLLLGQYEYMLNVIHNITSSLTQFFTFILGIIVGLFSFVRLISFLFRKYHDRTVLFLIGLMSGSLVLPLKNIIFVNQIYPNINFSFGATELIIMTLSILIGVMVVRTISRFEK
jgi:putative membrane protein